MVRSRQMACVHFLTYLLLTPTICYSPIQYPAGGPHIIGCPRLFIQYIHDVIRTGM
jgi:hypothetical protein